MKKIFAKTYFTSLILTAIVSFLLSERLWQSEKRAHKTELERVRVEVKNNWVEITNTLWREKIAPALVDSAFERGITFQDSICRQQMIDAVELADSLGYEKGFKEATLLAQKSLNDTISALQQTLVCYGEEQFEAGCNYREKGKKNQQFASIPNIEVAISKLQFIWYDSNLRWVWGTLSFGLSFLLMRFLFKENKRLRFKWKRKWFPQLF